MSKTNEYLAMHKRQTALKNLAKTADPKEKAGYQIYIDEMTATMEELWATMDGDEQASATQALQSLIAPTP